MTIQEFKSQYWQYYLMLERKFINTLSYVELCEDNVSTYSNEYAHLLQAIGAELDCFFKVYCGFQLTENRTIADYANFILNTDWPDIKTQIVKIAYNDIERTPFEFWDASRAKQTLSCWEAFDKIKHGRTENMPSASLENVLNILAALYMVEMKYFKKLADENGMPDVMKDGSDFFILKDWNTRYMGINDVVLQIEERPRI